MAKRPRICPVCNTAVDVPYKHFHPACQVIRLREKRCKANFPPDEWAEMMRVNALKKAEWRKTRTLPKRFRANPSEPPKGVFGP